MGRWSELSPWAKAASELHHRPNFAGRALKSARTQVIGLVVPDLTNALFAELMHGCEDEAAARGNTLLLGRADDVRPGSVVLDDKIRVRIATEHRPSADGSATTRRWPMRASRYRRAMRHDWDTHRRTGALRSNA